MADETTGNIPAIPVVHPNGTRFCDCGETTRPGKFFVITHDRRAEARVIRGGFGNIATFVVWAERYLPKIDDRVVTLRQDRGFRAACHK